jgi:hypothetical protein
MRYTVGQRWYSNREKEGRPSHTFVIIGPGDTPREKMCRLENDDPTTPGHGIVQSYSHAHLKKYAVLVTE